MKKMNKLGDIIKLFSKIGDKLEIHYRTYLLDGTDIFAGTCYYDYKSEELISADKDNYSLNDEFDEWELSTDTFSGKQYLSVWYESNWIK